MKKKTAIHTARARKSSQTALKTLYRINKPLFMAVTSLRYSNINALSVFGVLGANALAVIVEDAQAVDAEVFRVVVRVSVQYGQLAVD
jgi:5-keto 4-deoxyuronate isomerase